MPVNVAFTMSLTDILIFGAIILFAFYGFRRGLLRALFSFFRIFLSFIITAIFYERAALLLQARFDISSYLARMICFPAIFAIFLAMIWTAVAILKKVSKPLQTSGSLSKIVGTILGLMEGVLIVSIVIMYVEFYPAPSEIQFPLENAISYRAIRPVAPSIRNLTMGRVPRLKEMSGASEPKEGL